MTKEEYMDQMILAFRQKYEEIQWENRPIEENFQGETALKRVNFFGQRFSLLLPKELQEMDEEDKEIKYPNKNRPEIVLADRYEDATLTFSLLQRSGEYKKKEPVQSLKEIKQEMRKQWKEQVFYDSGQIYGKGLEIAWIEYRGFCLNGNLYSLLFLLFLEEEMILGNFHCSFQNYDSWKPIILKLLETIQAG